MIKELTARERKRIPAVSLELSHHLLNTAAKKFNEELILEDARLKAEWQKKAKDWQELADAGAKGLPPLEPYKSIYKERCCKATYLDTAKQILNRVREKINNCRDFLQPYEPVYITRRELANRRGLSVPTISRHLDWLQDFGAIDRRYRGYTHAQEIRFNPAYMAAVMDAETCLKVVEKYQFSVDNTAEKYLKGQLAFQPFADLFAYPIVSSCDYKDDSLNHIQNIKQHDSGVFGSNAAENGFLDIGLNTECKDTPPLPPPAATETKHIEPPKIHGDKLGYLEAQRKQMQQNTLESYVRLTLRGMLNILYPDYKLHEAEEMEVKRHIRGMFLYSDGSPMDAIRMGKKYTELIMRFCKVYGWKYRSPNRYLTRPSTYLNPALPNGFKNTEAWIIADKQKERENPDWNKNTRLMVELVRKYHSNPTLQNYTNGIEQLKRKQTPALTRLYAMCVLDSVQLNEETIKAAWIGGKQAQPYSPKQANIN